MNKGYLFLAVCILYLSNNVMAQDKPISYEFQSGMTLSTMKDKLNKSDWGVGMYSKGLVDFKVAPNFSIGTGLGYRYEQFNSKSGFTYYTNEGYKFDQTGQVQIQRHWLEVPILFKGHFYLNGSNKLEVYAGPQISMLIGAKNKDLATGEIVKINLERFMDRLDYGLNLGVSYIFKERWAFNFNYSLGLRNDFPVADLRESSRSISIGVGYRF